MYIHNRTHTYIHYIYIIKVCIPFIPTQKKLQKSHLLATHLCQHIVSHTNQDGDARKEASHLRTLPQPQKYIFRPQEGYIGYTENIRKPSLYPQIAILMGKTQTILCIWSYPPLRKTHVCPFSPDSHIDLTHPTDSTGNQWISRQFSAINSGPDAKFVSSGFHSKDR